MVQLSDESFTDVLNSLDVGFVTYINKKTGKVISVPTEEMLLYGDPEPWEAALQEVEDQIDDLIKIDKMDSRSSYRVMEDFTAGVENLKHKLKLETVLEGRKPFRNFKDQLYYMDDLIDDWYKFRDRAQKRYLMEQLKRHEIHYEGPGSEFGEEAKISTTGAPHQSIDPGYDLQGRTFRLVDNTKGGSADFETIFKYSQEGNSVKADYQGGEIRHGHLIGKLIAAELNMYYHCETVDGKMKAGKALAKLSRNDNGKIVMKLNWEWLEGGSETGRSEYFEI